jgi:transposase
MDKESLEKRVFYLRTVEKLTYRQIAMTMNIGRDRVSRILKQSENSCVSIPKPGLLDSFRQLIAQWYTKYPRLKAIQIYERIKSYGYTGSYPSVVLYTQNYRRKRKKGYHRLNFLPGEEAQIDWFFFNHQILGKVAGFLYVLSYSRYAWGMFYPKTTFEFFLAGHLECFQHLNGLAHAHRYDNLKSVVIRRNPQIEYNGQFLDFARFYHFSIRLCNPAAGNEKGRVERLIRDIRVFLYGQTFSSLEDLNEKFHIWLIKRNNTIHRSTQKTPKELLSKEHLIILPKNGYPPKRDVSTVLISKTAFVDFDTNKYSVPVSHAQQTADILAYPDTIAICVRNKKVAIHQRSFKSNQIIENPLHREKLLEQTPHFKMRRILELFQNMDPDIKLFLGCQQDHASRLQAAYQLFQLRKTHSKIILTSAIRQLNQMGCYQIKALRSLLNLPQEVQMSDPLWPQNTHLLNLNYQQRRLEDYDPH